MCDCESVAFDTPFVLLAVDAVLSFFRAKDILVVLLGSSIGRSSRSSCSSRCTSRNSQRKLQQLLHYLHQPPHHIL
jgi:hypothetical protein